MIQDQSLPRLHRHRLSSHEKVTIGLMASIIPVCSIHQMFGAYKINGFIVFNYPLEAYWYVYFLSRSIAWVLASLVLVRVTRNGLRFFSKLFFSYCVYGLAMFFINFNSVNYYYVPLIIIAIICNKIYS